MLKENYLGEYFPRGANDESGFLDKSSFLKAEAENVTLRDEVPKHLREPWEVIVARNSNTLKQTSIRNSWCSSTPIVSLLALCVLSCTPAKQQSLAGASAGDLNPTSTGAVVGAAIGAAGGAIIGSATGDAGPGLAIGAAGGALTGGIIGRGFQQQDEEILQQREVIARQSATIEDQGRQINELRRGMADGAGEYSLPSSAPSSALEEQDVLPSNARFQMNEDADGLGQNVGELGRNVGLGEEQIGDVEGSGLPRATLPAAGLPAATLPVAAGSTLGAASWNSPQESDSATAGSFVNGRYEIPAKNRPSVEKVEEEISYDGNPQAQPFLGSIAEHRANSRADARASVRARLGVPSPELSGLEPLDSFAATQGASSVESVDLMPMVDDAQKTQLPPANRMLANQGSDIQAKEPQMLAAAQMQDEAAVIEAPKPAVAVQSFGAASLGATSMEPPLVTPSPTGKAKVSLPAPSTLEQEIASAKPIRLSKGTRLINPGKRELSAQPKSAPLRLGRNIGQQSDPVAKEAPLKAPAKAPIQSARSNLAPSLPPVEMKQAGGAIALEDELPLAIRPAQSQKALELAAMPSSGVRLGDLEKRKPSPRAKKFSLEEKKSEEVAKKVTKPKAIPTTKKTEPKKTVEKPKSVQKTEEEEAMVPVVTIVKSDDTAAPLVPKDTNCMEGETEAERARSATSDSDKIFYYRRALRLCPKEPVYHIELGRMYSELGKTEDARFSFTKALELDPENEIAQDELSLLMLESDSNVY